MIWLDLFLLVVAVAASLWPRHYPQGHPKAGKTYTYPVFAILAAFPLLFLLTTHLAHVSGRASVIFWSTWAITLLVVAAVTRRGGFWGALVALVAVMGFVLLPFNSDFGHHTSGPQAQAITVATADGSKQLDYISSAANAQPVSGKDTTGGTDTQPSLRDGKGPVHSWTELVQRVNALPKDRRDAYIAAINARSQYLGTWDDVQKYAALEKQGGLDTRVILILNTPGTTDQQARDDVRSDVGAATDKLPIVRASGALVNTRGVDAGKIEDFADGRSQIRVILTVPQEQKKGTDITYAANTVAASKGTGVLTECTNPSTGIVHHPTPVPVTPSTPSSTPTTKSPSPTPSHTTSTPTPTPSTSTSTPTPTPTTSTSTPTPTPTTSTPTPTPSCTTGQVNSPSGCLNTKDPGGNLPGPSGKPTATQSVPVETTTPVETNPANPSTTPGSGATDVPAPGSTQDTNAPTSAPTATGAPSGGPGTGSNNPDGNTAAGLLAPFGLLGGALWRRRRIGV